METLPELLECAARFAPHCGISVYDRRGQTCERRTYGRILDSARDSAGRLAALGIRQGDRVLVGLPTTWNLIQIYFGVILRGAYPTIVPHTGMFGGGKSYTQKLSSTVRLLGAKLIVCETSTRNELVEHGYCDEFKITVSPDELSKIPPLVENICHIPGPEELAFIQMTSGSTGQQRAISISHRSACHNAWAIGKALSCIQYSKNDSGVSWLPMNHDMGLVGCLLFSIAYGFDLQLLRPETFLAKPRQWLQIISDCGATMTTAPNFAYQSCLERIGPELSGLDLSSVRSLMTGAEIIRADTCNAFQEKFAPFGLQPGAFVPCYGLAEATLAVTFETSRNGVHTMPVPNDSGYSKDLPSIVSNGKVIADTEMRIVVPGRPTEILADGMVGEVCVKGPGVFLGYYGEARHQDWLYTGDLGFICNSELYLTGRCKDVLIIRGKNLMPSELEWIAERELGGGGTERTCAFSVQSGHDGEQAVLVVEIPQSLLFSLQLLDRGIRARIVREIGISVADLVFIRRGQIPKTTSGKVQRNILKQRYLADGLERIHIGDANEQES